jgi:NADPH2:quinone reductase
MIPLATIGYAAAPQAKVIEALKAAGVEVLIDVRAVGLNFGETAQRSGRFPSPAPLPRVLGGEVVGVTEEGRRVAARVTGGYATRAVAAAEALIPLPDSLGFEEAIVVPVQGMTAATMVWEAVDPQPGTRVLVHSAAGGIGTLLVQLLKERGATVIAAASSPAKLELAASLGADAGVDYSEDGWVERVVEASGGGVDWALVSSGGDRGERSFDTLRTGGTLLMYGSGNTYSTEVGQARINDLMFKSKRLMGFSVASFRPERAGAVRDALLERLADGLLKAVIGGRYALDQVADAHRDLESGRTHGKLVLVP